jgi:hypothetical protein
MIAPAPGRFSTIDADPRARPMWSASRRAKVSELPPAGNGTMNLVVPVGWDCAPKAVMKRIATAATAAAALVVKRDEH